MGLVSSFADAFIETVEKLSSKPPVERASTYMQLRQGTRPYRAETLISRGSELYKKNDLPSKPDAPLRTRPEFPNSIVLPPQGTTLVDTPPVASNDGVR